MEGADHPETWRHARVESGLHSGVTANVPLVKANARLYIATRHNILPAIGATVFSPELKKGSIELLILSLLEAKTRHGYDLGKLIESKFFEWLE